MIFSQFLFAFHNTLFTLLNTSYTTNNTYYAYIVDLLYLQLLILTIRKVSTLYATHNIQYLTSHYIVIRAA